MAKKQDKDTESRGYEVQDEEIKDSLAKIDDFKLSNCHHIFLKECDCDVIKVLSRVTNPSFQLVINPLKLPKNQRAYQECNTEGHKGRKGEKGHQQLSYTN